PGRARTRRTLGPPRERDAPRDSRGGARSPGPGIDSPEGRARVRPGLQPADDSAPRDGPAARQAHDVRPRDALASGRAIVRAVDRAGAAGRTDAAGRQGGARVKAPATSFGVLDLMFLGGFS